MQTVTIEIKKLDVYNEVAKTTSYTGAKIDGESYERIFTTDADREMLERFWVEATNDATSLFKPFLTSVTSHEVKSNVDLTENYSAGMELSNSFDSALMPAMTASLFSYFVEYISSRWYEITNKAEAEKYATSALTQLDSVKEKLYYRKKPKRVKPTKK